MPRQFHRVVQHPGDHDPVGFQTVDEETARSANDARTRPDAIPAQPQVPGSDTGAEPGPRKAARPVGLGRRVAKRGDEQALATQPGGVAELLVRPGKDVDDVALGHIGPPIPEAVCFGAWGLAASVCSRSSMSRSRSRITSLAFWQRPDGTRVSTNAC